MNKPIDNSCNHIVSYYNRLSVSLGGTTSKYTSEEINKSILLAEKQSNLIAYYLDHIRNYNILTEDMLTNIDNFDNYSKMLIIRELNRVVTVINLLVD
jgi:hypothetical protein